jgi:PRTRC genetic system protein E
MFVELAPLVQSAGKLTVTIFPGPDGRMKVCVAPSTEKGKEVALATPLTLTATPQELDEGFAGAIATYQVARSSLAAQVEATETVLHEAKKTQSSKAVKALAKTPHAATSASQDTGSDAEDEEDEEEQNSGAPAATQQAPSPAPAVSTGTDLSSLI